MVKKMLAPGQYFVGDPRRVMQTAFYDAMITAMLGKTEACFELDKRPLWHKALFGQTPSQAATGSSTTALPACWDGHPSL